MKCMMSSDGARIVRVSDEEASELYHNENYKYVAKSVWKEKVRDIEKEDDLKILNLSGDLNWHPFVTGILGEYMDHLKGERKKFGFSKERKRWT